jgi:hypothetical protein
MVSCVMCCHLFRPKFINGANEHHQHHYHYQQQQQQQQQQTKSQVNVNIFKCVCCDEHK